MAPLSPVGFVVAAVVAVLAFLAGAGVAAAVLLGVIVAGGWAAMAAVRRPRAERIDPFTVQDPWRSMVMRAQSTRNRFAAAVRKTPPGPLHDRLADIGGRVDAAVREAWAIAKRGHDLDNAVQALDVPRIRRDLERGGDEAVVTSLRGQLSAGERLVAVSDDARTRLARLNAQLDESVAQAIELSVSAGDVTALQPLGSEVEEVVTELEALRLAMEETS
ncbi:MAG: hypothetical protein ACLGI2_14835 [Acidimicrobiia bacterium]